MYPIADALKKRFESGERKKAWITLSNASVDGFVITEEDIKADSFSIDRYCATGNKIEIGSAVSSEFSVVLNNSDGKFDGIVFEGSVLCVDVGFAHTTGNYVRCGFFTVDEPPRTFSTISLKALDYMMLYDKTIDRTKLNKAFYTPEELVRSISELCEIEVSDSIEFEKLPSADQSLSIPATATTYRQLLQWVAGITGTCAYIDWDGKLRMSWFVETDPNINITPAFRYSGNVHESDIKITGVTVKTQEATFTDGTETYPLVVEGNGFVYNGTEEHRATSIGSVVKDFTYRPYECTCLPMPYLFPLDRITYTDKSGKEISTVVTNHRFGLNSTSILAAQGETQQKKNYAGRRGLTKAEVDSAIAEAMKNFDSSIEHFYVMYSAYEKGRDTDGDVSMFDKVQADTAYLGTCATDSKTPPEIPEDYNWVKIRPEDGEPGRGVVSVKTQYYCSTSSATQTGGSWTDTMPAWVENTYLWKREVVTYENPAGTKTGTPILDTSWDALGDIKEDASDAKEKASAVDVASKELNKTLAGALGLHLTEQTIAGSVVRYYHTNPTLSASKSGDTILVLNAQGFGVCKSGWNNGNPQFSYGTTFDGKAVWDILTANKISADLIEAGKLKSVDGAAVSSTLNLDTGVLSFESGTNKILVEGPSANGNSDVQGVVDIDLGSLADMGIRLQDSSTSENVQFTMTGISLVRKRFVEEVVAWAKAYMLWVLNKNNHHPGDKPREPFVQIMRELLFSTNIKCDNLSFSPDGGNNHVNMADLYSSFISAKEALSAMQEKIAELEEKLDVDHEHIYTTEVSVSPTCTDDGERLYKCGCGYSYTTTIAALGHDYTSVVTPPTATAQGYTTHTCTRCGNSYKDNYTPATGGSSSGGTTNYTVKTVVSPSGAGTVTGAGTYTSGTMIQPKATPESGYIIKGWIVKNDDTGEEDNSLENLSVEKIGFAVDYNATITVIFESTSGDSAILKISAQGKSSSDFIQIYECYKDSTGVWTADYTKPLGTTTVLTSTNDTVMLYAKPGSGRKIASYDALLDGVLLGNVPVNSTAEFETLASYDSSISEMECKFYFAQA